MNHKFTANTASPTTCVKCSKDITAHSEFARCEVCNKFPCSVEIVNDYLMCPDCMSIELEKPVESKELPEPIARLERERFNTPADVIEKSLKGSSPLTDLPQNSDEFFNAETISHLAIEKKVMADDAIAEPEKWFFFYQQLQARQQTLQTGLVQSITLIKEIRSRIASVQRSQNLLASKLRAEQKAKLKIADISYVPTPAPKKVTARMTERDRTIESIAKALYAPRKDGKIIWDTLTSEERAPLIHKASLTFSGNISTINAAARAEQELDAAINHDTPNDTK